MKALSKILRFVKNMSGIWIELLENVKEINRFVTV